MFSEDKTIISSQEYTELIRASERIAVLKRLYEANSYVNTKDILAVLDIKENEDGKI